MLSRALKNFLVSSNLAQGALYTTIITVKQAPLPIKATHMLNALLAVTSV